jgi:CheY-like chemotaxis protein
MENAKVKIVLVEDDVLLLRMYEQKLVDDGFEVFTAENGAAGFELIKQHRPAIILSDIMMPDTNGLQLLEMIKNSDDAALRQIPVLMLTNLEGDEYMEKAKELGVTEYFVKSKEDPKDVVVKVKTMLGINQMPTVAPAATMPAAA